MNFYALSLVLGLLSLVACFGIVATQHLHGGLSMDSSHGVQRSHAVPSPRIGGLGIYLSLVVIDVFIARLPVGELLTPILLAGIPTFMMGLLEDLFKRGSIFERLGGTFISALLAWWLMDISLRQVGVAGLDDLLSLTAFSVLFTAFSVAGVANAVNIIDGFNGLASGVVVIAMAGLGAIAFQVGDVAVGQLAVLFIVAVLGFMVLNFPFGKIFLGDCGAYFLGFSLAWVAVLLVARNPEVSAWACLLVCAFPIYETLFSIVRRVSHKAHFGRPDRLHLHSLMGARWIQPRFAHWPAVLRNSMTSLPIWLFSLLLSVTGLVWFDHPSLLMICAFGGALFYWVWYLRIVRFGKEYR